MSSQPSRLRSATVMPRAPGVEAASSRCMVMVAAAVGGAVASVRRKVPILRRSSSMCSFARSVDRAGANRSPAIGRA
jgi:hypothetical protein